MSATDLIALAVRHRQARSHSAKVRALRALEAGVAKIIAETIKPGHCGSCGYKRRTRGREPALL